jgi:hypothetical protein
LGGGDGRRGVGGCEVGNQNDGVHSYGKLFVICNMGERLEHSVCFLHGRRTRMVLPRDFGCLWDIQKHDGYRGNFTATLIPVDGI